MTDEPTDPYPSPVAVLNAGLRHVRVLVLVPLLAMVLAGALAVLGGPSYMAESTFKPEGPRMPSGGGLFSMAAQLGVNMGSLSDGEGVDYFARLVLSREVLSEALQTEYRVTDDSDGAREVTLLEYYGIEGDTEDERLWNGVQRLREEVGVSIDQAAGVVTVTTAAPGKELAVQLNARLLELLNRFNLEKRQSQARAERSFVEAQTEAAAAELEAAEARLADFMSRNRRYQASPELATEAERLQRRVEFRQQLYTGMAQSFEQAKLDEVRNTPVFTVLDRPEGSARQVGGVLPTMFMGLLLGLVLAAFIVFVLEFVRSQRARHPEDFDELEGRVSGLLPRRSG